LNQVARSFETGGGWSRCGGTSGGGPEPSWPGGTGGWLSGSGPPDGGVVGPGGSTFGRAAGSPTQTGEVMADTARSSVHVEMGESPNGFGPHPGSTAAVPFWRYSVARTHPGWAGAFSSTGRSGVSRCPSGCTVVPFARIRSRPGPGRFSARTRSGVPGGTSSPIIAS